MPGRKLTIVESQRVFEDVLGTLGTTGRRNSVEILGHSFSWTAKYGYKIQHISANGLDRALLQSFELHEDLP